jgi:hypothetical protein
MRFFLSPLAACFVAAVALLPVACSGASDAASSDFGGSGGASNGQGAGATSGGAGGGDASIDIAEDGAAPSTDPTKPYAGLCSDGCSPGMAPDGCAPLQGQTGAGDEPVQTQFCQLVAGKNGVIAACGVVGQGEMNAPCQQVSDCGPGLACVATVNGGQCRPYCCGDVEACPEHTFCAPRKAVEDLGAPVPVCTPADDCQLLDDASCCTGGDCDLTCTIVRNDGTTSCVEPGPGKLGDACPCAAGYICTKLTNECKKLCHLGQDAVDCEGGGTCLGGLMGYPAGIGVCGGGAEKAY